MRWNKNGWNLVDHMFDYVAIGLLIFGFLLTMASGSKLLTYIIVYLCGLLVGRFLYMWNFQHKMRFWYPLIGFVIGLVLGARYGTFQGVMVSFVLGGIFGHYLQKKGHMR